MAQVGDVRRDSVVISFAFAAIVIAGLLQAPAQATHEVVTDVEGSAYGYYGNISHFGGPPVTWGPVPTATLPPGGSAMPVTSSAPTGTVRHGPATIFSSGPITVSTEGTTGPTGSVTSTATIDNINTSGQEVFTATNLSSTCTASEAGVVGSTTVVNGVLLTSEGDTPEDEDDTFVTIPANPEPNTSYEGSLEMVGDTFRYVFNEQIVNPDGSITVNAAHLYLLGPTAVGDLILGQVVCGVSVVAAPTTTTEAPTTTTTEPPSTMPTSKDQCKKGGYEEFGFRNQGQCVSFVASQGRSGGPA